MPVPLEQRDGQIFGPVSTDQERILFQEKPDSPATREILEAIGATAVPKTEDVALVVDRDEASGEEQPSHFVAIDPNDMGTFLLPRQGAAHLPAPEAAHAELLAQQEQPK